VFALLVDCDGKKSTKFPVVLVVEQRDGCPWI
jgi:hypothetical protein